MSELEIYLKEQDFWKRDTKEAVIEFYDYMCSKGISAKDALSWIEHIVAAVKDCYGD